MAKDKDVEAKGKELEAKAEELAKWANELQEKNEHLDSVALYLEQKEKELETREKALAEKGPSVAPAEDREKPLTKAQEKLIEQGCEAYGIAKEHLLKARIDPRTGEAVLVTNGGKKVRYAKGTEKVVPLDPVDVDGVPRKKPRHLMGKKKK
jgi:uncharacterized protein (DUF3084 family)